MKGDHPVAERIVIDPVTRIEGHAKITIHLDDAGQVAAARFHVTEFRGFERFCVGRPFTEMAGLCARICGICPVSHLLASSKAGDRLLAVTIPPAAEKLRRLMNLGQIIQSHALSFFHLSGPDLLLGWDSPPDRRNLFGLIAAQPELARGGIRLRQFGQEIIEALGGRKIHPAWCVPGGVREPLSSERRDHLRQRLPEARATALDALHRFKALLDQFKEEVAIFGRFPSLFLGLVGKDGVWEHYDGALRFVDSDGRQVAELADTQRFGELIGESVEPDSFLKSPFFKPLGYPQGIYRVGPLARLNVCLAMGTPLADGELMEYRQRGGDIVTASFFYHYARLIEILTATERIEVLLDDPDLTSTRLRARASINQLEGVGVSEAPRGTLFHHYRIDENGLMQKVNLIIATGQNNLPMNETITQIARRYIKGTQIPEGMLNRVEAGIRAFDPCLSCSTHAFGQMPLQVQLLDQASNVLDEKRR
jgi:NAD-reducing hydrogenase large subunit